VRTPERPQRSRSPPETTPEPTTKLVTELLVPLTLKERRAEQKSALQFLSDVAQAAPLPPMTRSSPSATLAPKAVNGLKSEAFFEKSQSPTSGVCDDFVHKFQGRWKIFSQTKMVAIGNVTIAAAGCFIQLESKLKTPEPLCIQGDGSDRNPFVVVDEKNGNFCLTETTPSNDPAHPYQGLVWKQATGNKGTSWAWNPSRKRAKGNELVQAGESALHNDVAAKRRKQVASCSSPAESDTANKENMTQNCRPASQAGGAKVSPAMMPFNEASGRKVMQANKKLPIAEKRKRTASCLAEEAPVSQLAPVARHAR